MSRAATALLVALALAPTPAGAEEGEWLLSFEPLYAAIREGDRTPSGGGMAIEVERGMTEALWLRGTVFWAGHPAGAANQKPAGLLNTLGFFAGISYAFDIIRVIPFLDASIGVLYRGGAGDNAADFGLELGVGLDYLIRREFSIGLTARYVAFLTSASTVPAYFYTGPRITVRWP